MEIYLNNISADTIVQVVSIMGATATFIIAQSVQKNRDRKLANREVYQQLELASIDLFRFEAGNVELIRPIWEKDKEIPSKNTAEYIVLMNYVCQILNLFEIAIRFRKDKTLLPDVFESWIAWFQLLVSSPGFPEIWQDIRMDYLTELRTIMDGGIQICQKEKDAELFESEFRSFVNSSLERPGSGKTAQKGNEKYKGSFIGGFRKKPEFRKNPALTEQISIKWLEDTNDAAVLAKLFIKNTGSNYISHSEIQDGRAVDEKVWNTAIQVLLSEEFKSAIQNKTFPESNIAAAILDQKIVGFALVEIKESPNGPFANLSDIIVDKDFRNYGIGAKLVEWIIPRLKEQKIKYLFAESNIKNSLAHKFLMHNDFSPVSKVFLKKIAG